MSGEFPTQQLDALAAGFSGRIGFYVKDLATGATYGYCADELFPTASVFKVAIMIELFRQAEEGILSLDDRRRLRGNISTHGSGVLGLLKDEPELSLRDYCRLMIAHSDNMATDLLLEVIGLPSANKTMDALGFPNTRVSMPIGHWHYVMKDMGHLPCTPENDAVTAAAPRNDNSLCYQASLENNVTTPREMGVIMERIHLGEIVSAKASAAMLEMLKRCNQRTKIPCHVDPKVEVAHKIGGSNRIQADAGIVFLPTGPLVISAFTLGDVDGSAGVKTIADMSRVVVAAISPESVTA
jgi:beta-lactamase class A